MRGRLASRAHSFKENILGAFGHHNASAEVQSPSSLIHAHDDRGNADGRSHGSNSTESSKKGQNRSHYSKNKNSGHDQSSGSNIRTLAKKTNSSDNLIEYSAPKCTDTLVREVQLALRYFEDAVAKGTYEMLPGCATVVLETVVAMQSFAISKSHQALQALIAKENEAANNGMTLKPPSAFENQGQQHQGSRSERDRFGIFKAIENVYSCLAKLTQWADRLIVEGSIDKEDDYVTKVIEPLRKSVLVLANAIANSEELNRKSTAVIRRSLPDVLAIEEYGLEQKDKEYETNIKSKGKPPSPPPKPKTNLYSKKAPPLPPKANLGKNSVSFSEDDIDSSDPFNADNVGSEGAKHLDWFSNPLFGQDNIDQNDKNKNEKSYTERKDKKKNKKKNAPCQVQPKKNDSDACSNQKHNIEASAIAVPDFCRPQRNSVCGIDLVLNSSDDHPTSPAGFDNFVGFDETTKNNSILRPLAASSPKALHEGYVKPVPITNVSHSGLNTRHHRDSSSSSGGDIPPALPRKSNLHAPISQPSTSSNNVRRKVSQYDNVFASPPPAMFLSPPPAIKSQSINPPAPYLKPIESTTSLFPNFRPEFMASDDTNPDKELASSFQELAAPNSSNMLQIPQHSALRAYSSEPPPPLPPKKRNIMSYMEMFGQSVLPTDTHFLQGVAQTQDLLQAVWHQNYHGFSDYIHDETSMNPHHLLPSSNFHQLSSDQRSNSLWNYHQKLMHDSLHTFGIPQNRKPMLPLSTKQRMEQGGDRFNMDQIRLSSNPNFDGVGFPALLPDQNITSRMPPPFPHSFGRLIIKNKHIAY